jgi:hypothetical protein
LELSRSTRKNEELASKTEEYKKQRDVAERSRIEILQKSSQTGMLEQENLQQRNAEYALEIQNIKQSKETLQREVEMLERTLKTQKATTKDAMNEISRLQGELAAFKHEKEVHRRDLSANDANRTELQIKELRKDLEKTVVEWQKSEHDKSDKVEALRQCQDELIKEKEKSSLLKTQVLLLEDRIRVMSQELAAFRSLDIYHTTMQSELKSYRSKSPELTQSTLRKLTDSPTDLLRHSMQLNNRSYLSNRSSDSPSDNDDMDINSADEDHPGWRNNSSNKLFDNSLGPSLLLSDILPVTAVSAKEHSAKGVRITANDYTSSQQPYYQDNKSIHNPSNKGNSLHDTNHNNNGVRSNASRNEYEFKSAKSMPMFESMRNSGLIMTSNDDAVLTKENNVSNNFSKTSFAKLESKKDYPEFTHTNSDLRSDSSTKKTIYSQSSNASKESSSGGQRSRETLYRPSKSDFDRAKKLISKSQTGR